MLHYWHLHWSLYQIYELGINKSNHDEPSIIEIFLVVVAFLLHLFQFCFWLWLDGHVTDNPERWLRLFIYTLISLKPKSSFTMIANIFHSYLITGRQWWESIYSYLTTRISTTWLCWVFKLYVRKLGILRMKTAKLVHIHLKVRAA